MSYHIIIPARMESSRLPGKPLLDIAGKPMIARVLDQCRRTKALSVSVATDSKDILQVVESFGGRALLTAVHHPSGTDRLEEAANQLGLDDDAIVVNVQGDEPLIPPAVIDQVADNLVRHADCRMATLASSITAPDEVFDPAAVKVVFDHEGRALYFSRAPVPWDRAMFSQGVPAALPAHGWYRHIGIYAYRVGLLRCFVKWPVAPLEATESLEQLRALCNGVSIHVAQAAAAVPAGVDTQADLERVRTSLATSPGDQ